MPVVTLGSDEWERFELKTAPPDGYIMLRPLPYGLKVQRRSKAMKVSQRVTPEQAKNPKNADQLFEMQSMDEWAVQHDFAYCIGEHNLQTADGTPVDFTNKLHIQALNPRVGSEIENLVDKLNNDDDELSLDDFLRQQSTSSEINNGTSNEVGKEDQTPAETH